MPRVFLGIPITKGMSAPVFFNLVASDGQVLTSSAPGVFTLQPKASSPPFGQITNFYVVPSLSKSLLCSSFLDMATYEPYYFTGQGYVLATDPSQLVPEIMLIKSGCGYKISVGKQYLRPPSNSGSMLSATPYTWKLETTGGPAFYLQTADGLFIYSTDGSGGFSTTATVSSAIAFELLQGNLVMSGTVKMESSSPQIICIANNGGKISSITEKVSNLGTGTGAITSSNTYTMAAGTTLGFDTNGFTTTGPAVTVIPTALKDTTKYAVYSIPILATVKFANPGSYTLTPIPANCKSDNGKKKLYIGLGVTAGVIVLIAAISISVWWSRKQTIK